MNPNDQTPYEEPRISSTAEDSKPALTGEAPSDQKNANSPKDYSDYWKALLGEFVHLLGLFWVHSQTAKTARASEVLFNQILQHLSILERMANHERSILIRRVHLQPDAISPVKEYLVLFGSLMISSKQEVSSSASKSFTHLRSALESAFECFADQEIHSLYLRMPGRSAEKIEQFRYTLHILTRYYLAARDSTSIAFRYYGRSLTVPLISGADGVPDPNLTVMAALNGLSAVNARELIRQAYAYHRMNLTEPSEAADTLHHVSCLDRIFGIRSLRSQIVRPPVEINNLIDPYEERRLDSGPGRHADKAGQGAIAMITCRSADAAEDGNARAAKDQPFIDSHAAIRRQDLTLCLDSADPLIHTAVADLYAEDYARLDPRALAERFASISRLLYAVDKKCQDPSVTEGIIALLHVRFKLIAEKVFANIIAHRQGLKIVSEGQAVLVGLVHPRFFDLIALTKEHVVAKQRMAIVKEIAFDVDPCHINMLADGFGIPVSEAHQIFGLLKGCFGASGSFIRPIFESRITAMTRFENVIFEILWCFLKQTPQRNDRLNFLNAIQLLMAGMNDARRALQFIIADICQNPQMVDYTDRNAFALANVLLHKENRELYVDINRTPEDVLKIQRSLNQKVRQYAIWRLEVDQGRFLRKLRTVASCVHQALSAESDTAAVDLGLPFLLALEREAFIFSGLVEGHTARVVLREALERYGDPKAPFYQRKTNRKHLSRLVPHLQIVVRALGRAGNYDDIGRLKSLERLSKAFGDLDLHPAHRLRVQQMMKWVPEAIKLIQSNKSQP